MSKVRTSQTRLAIATAHDSIRRRPPPRTRYHERSILAVQHTCLTVYVCRYCREGSLFTVGVLPSLIFVLQVAEKLETMMSDADRSGVVDIYHTIHSATLDGVGEGTNPTVVS